MKTILARDDNNRAVLCELRTEKGFLDQCKQADEGRYVVIPAGEVFSPGTLCTLCFTLQEGTWERWYHARVVAMSEGNVVLEVFEAPPAEESERWAEKFRVLKSQRDPAFSKTENPHTTTRLVHASLDFQSVVRAGKTLLLTNLSSRAFERNIDIIESLQALLARTVEPLPLNSEVDICLREEGGLRRWYKGRVVNVIPMGAAIQITASRSRVQSAQWSFVWQTPSSPSVKKPSFPGDFAELGGGSPRPLTSLPDSVFSVLNTLVPTHTRAACCLSTAETLQEVAGVLSDRELHPVALPIAASVLSTVESVGSGLIVFQSSNLTYHLLFQNGVALGAETSAGTSNGLGSYLCQTGHLDQDQHRGLVSWVEEGHGSYTEGLAQHRFINHRATLAVAQQQIQSVLCGMLSSNGGMMMSAALDHPRNLGASSMMPRSNLARTCFRLHMEAFQRCGVKQLRGLLTAHAKHSPVKMNPSYPIARLGLNGVEQALFTESCLGMLTVSELLKAEMFPWTHLAKLLLSFEQLGLIQFFLR